MSYKTNTDNLYKEGIVITANENPSLQLKIIKYYQRIYYCEVIGHGTRKHLVYFERDLIPPASAILIIRGNKKFDGLPDNINKTQKL